jgi:putative transposase
MWLRSATIRNVNRALREINAFEYEGDYRPATGQALKEILQDSYAIEVDEYLGRGWYERRSEEAVKDYRNGTQKRRFLTELGEVELVLNRTRRRFASRVLQSYARRGKHIDRLILACFVLGMSTRKVAEALVPLLGRPISPQLVSNVAKELDAHVARYHARRLEDRYRFLFFDGVTLTHKGAAKVQKRIILCAWGITHHGKQEMIDFLIASSESQGAWEGFLRNLYDRGLVGEWVELIVTDGCSGLINALEIVYARIPRQHCWAHKARNVLDKIPKRQRASVKRQINHISHAPSRQEVTRAFWSFCHKYRSS